MGTFVNLVGLLEFCRDNGHTPPGESEALIKALYEDDLLIHPVELTEKAHYLIHKNYENEIKNHLGK